VLPAAWQVQPVANLWPTCDTWFLQRCCAMSLHVTDRTACYNCGLCLTISLSVLMCITSHKCNSAHLQSVSWQQVWRLTPVHMPAAGTSSFGMSGVNAHMLLGAPARASDGPQQAVIRWRNARYWPVPPLSALLAVHILPPGVSPLPYYQPILDVILGHSSLSLKYMSVRVQICPAQHMLWAN